PRSRSHALQHGQYRVLATFGQGVVELELDVEMVLYGRLVAARDEDEVLDPGLACLVDAILDHRAVDDGEHLLGNGLGGGQKAIAETGHWASRRAAIVDAVICSSDVVQQGNAPASGTARG